MAEQPNVTPTVKEWKLNSIAVTLNGYHVQGSGDAHEVLRLNLPARYKKRMGADGHVEYIGTGHVGGEVVITLRPPAPSLLTMVEWRRRTAIGNHTAFHGAITCPDGSQLQLHSGLLTGPSKDFEKVGYDSFRFYFGEIT